MINQFNGGTTTGSVTVSLTADNSTIDYQEVTAGTYNIAAGQYQVKVRNIGLTNITVAGDAVTPGNTVTFDVFQNFATGKLDLTPAVEIIVPAGGRAAYTTVTPS